MRPLAIDLFCGLGGWAEGFLSEGYRVIGFDIERHRYWMPETSIVDDGMKHTKPVAKRGWTQGCAVALGLEGSTAKERTRLMSYPGQLVLQDVLTLHGSQFRDAAVIVASPPCQEYSYRAMPWKRAKALPPPSNELFEACFRIQREACEAAGRYIPLVVENVKGAQKWVGRAKWHFGSYYLWGDVPAIMPFTVARKASCPGSWFYSNRSDPRDIRRDKDSDWVRLDGTKFGSGWWHDATNNLIRKASSRSSARKAASALIAKIPFPLAQHIAQVYKSQGDYQ